MSLPTLHILTSPDWVDYELVDCGDGSKLERYGDFFLIRPEAEAVWQPHQTMAQWRERAHAEFFTTEEKHGGHWRTLRSMPDEWRVRYKNLVFSLECKGSRQIGLFPEQAAYWDWISQQVSAAAHPIKVLNLFGYTGAASLAAAAGGAQVTHLDASKHAVTWARSNAAISGLQDAPIRWIVDDALKFVQREKRRESYYEGIILDPPKFGRGPKGEVWEFYKLLAQLLQACGEILSPQASFFALTAYAVKASPITLLQAIAEITPTDGVLEAGEITLQISDSDRLLPTAIFARWHRPHPTNHR
jgi:23S rRNA (cytosine1962-C5)-methyltransferase